MKLAQARCRFAADHPASIAKARSSTNQRSPNRALTLGGNTLSPGTTTERAVVATVAVAVEVVDPLSVTEEGEIEQVAATGTPVQLSDTDWLNPLDGVIVSV